jgi:cellulose synthase/poly-beta-1,6-N-acetylglucosamine synthase-like glycosyltransferase
MVLWVTLLLLLCNFSGYVVILYLLSRWKPAPLPPARGNLQTSPVDPLVYVLVPVWNERSYLREKLVNLMGLQYERSRLKILICDSGSTDGSKEEIADLLGNTVQFLDCPERGKISQLNYGLSFVPEHALVAVSDADSLLERPDSLLRAVDYFSDAEMGAVGAWTIPGPGSALGSEKAYWDKQNRMRYLETKACTSSIVTAQFYLCRKTQLPSFPADCVADDVYVALAAHSRNLRVVYAHEIEAVERRQPSSLRELFFHKLRKANAYTVELLRPLHRLPHLGKRRKFIYLFKVFQFFYLPWAACFFLASCALRLSHGEWRTVLAAIAILFFTTLLASLLMEPPPGKERGGFIPSAIFQTIVVFSLVNLVLLANSLAFPFWAQDSRYARVSDK